MGYYFLKVADHFNRLTTLIPRRLHQSDSITVTKSTSRQIRLFTLFTYKQFHFELQSQLVITMEKIHQVPATTQKV